ncbi:hypothetical protein AgCh_003014 [Apium graveolens]
MRFPESETDSELSADEAEVPELEVDGSVQMDVRKKRRRENDRPLLIWEVWEEEHAIWLASHEDADIDMDNQNDVLAETAEAPPTLIVPLLRYQKEWLAWALKQEESAARGGILADEMGMGKTLQAIALVLAKQGLNQAVDGALTPLSQYSRLPKVKATLVICPLVAVVQWVNEISRSTLKGSNKVLVYHGAKRAKTLHEFSDYDFVITTYSIVESEFRKYVFPLNKQCNWCDKSFNEQEMYVHLAYFCGPAAIYKPSEQRKDKACGSGAGNCNLHSMNWSRIILDEAHYIKNRSGSTTKAVLALKSSYKWALSGTPLQNHVKEIYSLHIASPIKVGGNSVWSRNAMILLKHKILKSVMLRRTKQGRSADLALPPKMILLRRDSLDIKEDDYYTSLYTESRAQFNTYVAEGTVMNNYANIFDILTRLRKAVNHPYLVVYSKTAMSRNPSAVLDANDGEVICGLCHESVEDHVEPLTADFITRKDHGDEDTKNSIKGFKRSSILNRIRLDDFQTSTKIEALKEEFRFMIERDGSAKGIVFSQFPSFLDLIHYSLQRSGIQCVQLDGYMTMRTRDAAITRFTEDPDCRLFLMSLKAGGVALDLPVASHVFLMDPWWNPAVEQQAQDRIHRIGQYKPTRQVPWVVRFIIEDTVEEKILLLQERKKQLFEGTVGGSDNALQQLTANDIKFLFNL